MLRPAPVRGRKTVSGRPYHYRPQLVLLEDRLPLGDGVLGLLVGAALLPAHAAPAAVPPTPEPAAAPGVGRVSNPSPWPDGLEIRPTQPFAAAASAALAALVWAPLTDPFAAAARRRHDTLVTNPPREQGPDAPASLTLRVGEAHVSAHPSAPSSVRAASPSDTALLATLAGMRAGEAPSVDAVTPTEEAQVQENFGRLPLYFEENVGQTDASVHFLARGPGYGLFLTGTEAVMVLQQPAERAEGAMLSRPCLERMPVLDCMGRESMAPAATAEDTQDPPAVVRMQVLGGNPSPAVTGRAEQPGKVNYFLGNDPTKWHTNIATFGRVEYDEVYPDIDLVWHGSNRQLEYDFVVAPGVDPNVIRVGFTGAERLELDAVGDLLVTAGGQELRQHAPFVYQDVNGTRQEVASRFVLHDRASGVASAPRVYEVGFVVGAYDAGRPLVIDPVLSYSTYLGGSGGDRGYGIAVDPATGDALLTGWTSSFNFPTANPLQATLRGFDDAFVARLSASGSALVFSTYLGGSGGEVGSGIAVHPGTGDALLTGWTTSFNFPTANPLQGSNRGGNDAFVARLSASGSALVFSTYLGGSGGDLGYGIAMDPATGDALLTGLTTSTNFPTAIPLQATYGGGFSDAFVARLSASGSALVYSTYLGGSSEERSYALAVDPATGDALVTGNTASTNFPTANPLQAGNRGGRDAFVARLSASGSALVFATYLGGSNDDDGYALAVDPATGDALLTGWTSSFNFPTANPLQTCCAGDAFVTRLNAAGSALVFSTYLGGSHSDSGSGIAVDPVTGDALLTGATYSTDFPTVNPLQAANRGYDDVFVARLNAAGSALVFATYLGGSAYDYPEDIAVDPTTGDALLTGWTESTDFPTANPLQSSCAGFPCADPYVTRIGSSPVASYYVYPDGGQVTAGVPFDLYVFALDAGAFVIPDYAGAIGVFTTDPLGTPMFVYQFRRIDRGVASFAAGMTLRTPGLQEVFVFDVATFTVWGYAAFDVRP